MKKLLWISVLLVTNCLSTFAQTTNPCTQLRPKLSGTVIGTSGSWNNSGNTRDKAFDGNTATYFDAPNETAWVGLSLPKATHITGISFFPRAGSTARMIGGVFQGSNTADFSSGVVNLSLGFSKEPTLGWNCVAMANVSSFKYVRFLSGGFGNIAEIEFYGVENTCDFNAPNSLVVVGNVIGSTGSYNNSGNTREKAFDNDTTTSFDATTGVAWAGLAASNGPTNFVGVKFFPRTGATSRMVGGKFQGSNTADFSSGVIDLATITTEPTLGWNCLSFNKPNSFGYVRYISPSGGFGNVAEIVFYGILNRCPGYKINISDTGNTICAGSSKELYAIAPPGSTNFKWSPSTGLNRTDNFNVIASPNQTTTYTVTADPNPADNCQVKVFGTVTVVVNPALTVSTTASKSTITSGESSTLTASGATTYTWSPSAGLSATTGASVVATPTQTTTYTVTGVSAGCSKTSTVTITVNPVNTGLTVWIKKKANTQAPRIHYWNAVPSGASSTWPGELMTQDLSKGADWYKFTIQNATSTNLLFHDNAGFKTANMTNVTGGCYDANTNTWINCNEDNPPVLTVSPAGGNFSSPISISNPLIVTLSATDDKDANPKIFYTLGERDNEESLTIVKTGTINIFRDITLKVFAFDNANNKTLLQTHNYTFNQDTGLTVWMKKKANTQAPRIHYWNAVPSGASSTWPGELMTQDLSKGADWYKFTIQNATSTNLLFHDNAGFKTVNMTNVTGGCYDANNGSWLDCNQDNVPLTSVSPIGGNYTNPISVSISATDDKDANPRIYYTLDGSIPTTSSLYFVKAGSLSISSDTTLKLFAKDSANNTGQVITYNYTFNQVTGLTVWFKKPSNMQAPRMHYWNAAPAQSSSAWPGVLMTPDPSKGADWYSFTIQNATGTNLLFHDNAGYKTIDMNIIGDGCYDGNSRTWINCSTASNRRIQTINTVNERILKVYPNPASESTNINYSGTQSKSIEMKVYDVLGHYIYAKTEEVIDGTFAKSLDTSNFKSGIYIVSIIDADKVIYQKLIIK